MASDGGDAPVAMQAQRASAPLPQPGRVKNKAPAAVQITAEQIVREASAQQEATYRAPAQKITDQAELDDYRMEQRKHFEDNVRRERWKLVTWMKYAKWEAQQGDYRRARSVWERALEVDHRHPPLWINYAEMEMRAHAINHARNVWDRAVTVLPRIDQLWYKYVHMEEMLENVPAARAVFERWMRWEPDEQAWRAYINMELRYKEYDNARNIYEQMCAVIPSTKTFVSFAKFETKFGTRDAARGVYEHAVQTLAEEEHAEREELFLRFADFEERCKEYERCRAIYRLALELLPKSESKTLYDRYTSFEKQRGDRKGIESVVVAKRRQQYEAAVAASPTNYDAWFDYVRLEEGAEEESITFDDYVARVRETYERAVANVPPAQEKRYWRRYMYLWINYALFEELVVDDIGRAREVYAAALKLVPHRAFTFGKLWILAAKLELRALDLGAFRRTMGRAIGLAPKRKVFKAYIDIEMQLGQVDRCRTLFGKRLEWAPGDCGAWIDFAELEASLGEAERARAIFELAVDQPVLDAPEAVWKAYIDFEIAEGEYVRTRALYERLLSKTQHVKVWLSYALFEMNVPLPSEEAEGGLAAHQGVSADDVRTVAQSERVAAARRVFRRAEEGFKKSAAGAAEGEAATTNEERVALLEAWLDAERAWGELGDAASIEGKMPRRVKRKRQLYTEAGDKAGFEEYYDYVFPDEGGAAGGLKILEAAYRWKRKRAELEERKAAGTSEEGGNPAGAAGDAGALPPPALDGGDGSALPPPALDDGDGGALPPPDL